MSENINWWQEAVIYQIYPRSFSDSNGDGLGDLPGITAHLDYLADLGIDAIWLSPFYPSPDTDFGYDISDYTDVDPRFGTLADFDHLLHEAHQRSIRVILDLVLNHTSDQHTWFIESRQSRENPKRDWYIWRDPGPKGGVPNNWQASFGGSAWEFDQQTGQYYLHSFLKQQPDVNWHNPELRQAQLDVFRFWLERGVDGFRLDVFNAYFKDELFRSNPGKFGLRAFDRQNHIYDMNQPELDGLLIELRQLLDSYPERYAVGETYVTPFEKAIKYVGNDRLHAAFSFDFFETALAFPWNPRWLLQQIKQRDALFDESGLWPTTVMSNHDQPRAASRYAPGFLKHTEADHQSLIAMTLLLTLRGTPFMYYGEEIGMRDIDLKYSEIMDPPGKKYWPVYKGRDGCRSPMQWSSASFAGFSTSLPWLKLHPNYVQRNIATQQVAPGSLLNQTRRLIALRRQFAALRRGSFRAFYRVDTGVLAYERKLDDPSGIPQRILVYLNFSRSTRAVGFVHDSDPKLAKLLFSSVERKEFYTSYNQFVLNPYEVLLLEVKTVEEG
ncbi:MAG: alpha-amylase family glycosyl hydrolase [Chloroflexota bacterium]